MFKVIVEVIWRNQTFISLSCEYKYKSQSFLTIWNLKLKKIEIIAAPYDCQHNKSHLFS